MTIEIRLREVPGDVHRAIKSEAALLGMTLNEYLLKIVKDRDKNKSKVLK